MEHSNLEDDPESLHDLGMQAWFDGKDAEAAKFFKQASRLGYLPSMVRFAKLTTDPEDDWEKGHFLKKAVEAGSFEAVNLLADHYTKTHDYDLSIEMFHRARAAGNRKAWGRIGGAYLLKGDLESAEEWYEKASIEFYDENAEAALGLLRSAKKGDPEGMYFLGRLYQIGNVPDRAIYWLSKAAPNYGDAAYDLGCLYEKDYRYGEAIEMFTLATKHGHEEALYRIKNLMGEDSEQFQEWLDREIALNNWRATSYSKMRERKNVAGQQ